MGDSLQSMLLEREAMSSVLYAGLGVLAGGIIWWLTRWSLREVWRLPEGKERALLQRGAHSSWVLLCLTVELMAAAYLLRLAFPSYPLTARNAGVAVALLLVVFEGLRFAWVGQLPGLGPAVWRATRRGKPFDADQWLALTRRRLGVGKVMLMVMGAFVVGFEGWVIATVFYPADRRQLEAEDAWVLSGNLERELAGHDVKMVTIDMAEGSVLPHDPLHEWARRRLLADYGSDHVVHVLLKAEATAGLAKQTLAASQAVLSELGRQERWKIIVRYGRVGTGKPRPKVEGWYEPEVSRP
jgi:hypothetical protein